MKSIIYFIEFKTLWRKVKLLIMSSFSFCRNVFKNVSCRCVKMRWHVKKGKYINFMNGLYILYLACVSILNIYVSPFTLFYKVASSPFLAQLFEEYESYYSHLQVSVGVGVVTLVKVLHARLFLTNHSCYCFETSLTYQTSSNDFAGQVPKLYI